MNFRSPVYRLFVPQGEQTIHKKRKVPYVERAESAYAKSIEKLSAVTAPSLDQSASPLAAVYREKLVLLDSAIVEIKSNIESNRYNMYLQNQLASLYREKQIA